jgi:cell division protein FtsZ
MGGKDLTMAEVNRVMEQIGRQCERAQIIMGAAVDAELKNKLSVTVIAAKQNLVAPAELPSSATSSEAAEQIISRGAARPAARCAPQGNPFTLQQREQTLAKNAVGRARKTGSRMRQEQLPLTIVSNSRFDKSEPTIHKGEDLDIPTYLRRGVPLN